MYPEKSVRHSLVAVQAKYRVLDLWLPELDISEASSAFSLTITEDPYEPNTSNPFLQLFSFFPEASDTQELQISVDLNSPGKLH